MQELCINCVNFTMDNKELCTCDYEYWENIPLKQAVLYVPEMYGCIEYEFVENFNK